LPEVVNQLELMIYYSTCGAAQMSHVRTETENGHDPAKYGTGPEPLSFGSPLRDRLIS